MCSAAIVRILHNILLGKTYSEFGELLQDLSGIQGVAVGKLLEDNGNLVMDWKHKTI